MAATHNSAGSGDQIKRPLNSAQRRAAESAALADQQARLKQEAAERRAKRAGTTEAVSLPRTPAGKPRNDAP